MTRRHHAAPQTRSAAPTTEPVVRQTRHREAREARYATEIAQRGTIRRRNRSIESVATTDFPKSSVGYVSPRPESEDPDLPSIDQIVEMASAVPEEEIPHESPEIEAARVQDMLEFDIPKLSRWSKKMHEALSSIGDDQPSEEQQSTLKDIRRLFAKALLALTDNPALFITRKELPANYSSRERATVRLAILSGNLMSLVASIRDTWAGERENLSILEELDNAFPASFTSGLGPSTDVEDAAEILGLAFHIRCCCLVASLAANPNTEPYKIVSDIFCNRQTLDMNGIRMALRDRRNLKMLAGIDINEGGNFRDIVDSCIQDLISALESDDRSAIYSSLNQLYSRDKLFTNVYSWAMEKFRQLNQDANHGDIGAATSPPASHANAELGEPAASPPVDNGGGADSDSNYEFDAADGDYDQLPQADSNLVFISKPTMLTDAVQGESALHTRELIRGLDPEQVLSQIGKQPRPTRESEAETDDDFETNQKPPNKTRRREDEASASLQPRLKRPRPALQPPATTSRPPSLTRDFEESDVAAFSVKAPARESFRSTYRTRNNRRQTRQPWSDSDTARLLNLISNPAYGGSWSIMAQQGKFEPSRDQQALRDKARNMKVKYLVEDRVLPRGFDGVILSSKQRAIVIREGKNPERREDDVNEDGLVSNNIIGSRPRPQ
ncbi:hypothetical protein GGS23DRAFT_549709 [Durotheca rogersii]|uniref:uncharacterized protein n=1 Tax=Durotheca rogersii TaxID=419775 RepID=UPI00221E8D15|nr:uncharacterized protein GGS23DRAFT_549709 [Durotheca rogersii]KAI5867739.1 hypothetical protein GGS23DRAFT_549709 [Durotheca rogersii]